MTWLFDGFVSWLASLVAQVFDTISSMFTSALSCDLTTFDNVFSFAKTAENIILGLGLTILFLILIFQLFRVIWGPLSDNTIEHPVALLVRSMVFFPLVYFSKSIVIYVLYLANTPYNLLSNASTTTVSGTTWASGIQNNLQTWVGAGVTLTAGPLLAVITLVFLILIGFNYIKMLLEVCERYVVLGIVAYTAPLAVATGGSKATNQIFKGWCRLVGSQTLLMIFNVWFLKLITSALDNASTYFGTSGHNFLIWALLIVAMEKAAMHMDSYMKSIIGNVAITGGGILDDMVATAGGVKAAMGAMSGKVRGFSGGGGGGSSVGTSQPTGGTVSSFFAGLGRKFAPSSFAADAVAGGGTRQSVGGWKAGLSSVAARGATGAAFKSSLNNGGNFATSVIGRVAHGSGNKDYGFMNNSETANKAFAHFFDSDQARSFNPASNEERLKAEQLRSVSIGNGQATAQVGNETVLKYSDASQYRAPTDSYSKVRAADGSEWYRQEYKVGEKAPRTPERL